MPGHDWFRPLHRRLMITAVCLAWLAFEAWQGGGLFFWIALGVLAYAVWDFFLSGQYDGAGR